MYYAVNYKSDDSYLEKRAPYRQEHLALVQKAFDEGILIMAGALTEPTDSALLIFRSDSTDPIEDFLKKDPYIRHGVIREWDVRPWSIVVGG